MVSSWGGELEINSEENKGTEVKIILKKAKPPHWFVPEIKISKESTVVVIDDDNSIHYVWQKRLEKMFEGSSLPKIIHFSKSQDVYNWFKEVGYKNTDILYLIDFELIGDGSNGLEIIEKLGIEDRSILVTSRYEESKIESKTYFLNLKMIPKALAGLVPISIVQRLPDSTIFDCVLIDDDPTINYAWKESSTRKGLNLKTFSNPEPFLISHKIFDRNIDIYLDRNLGNGIQGEIVAKQLFELGFKNIYLATGQSEELFSKMPWLKGVYGKTPPWEN
jgi:FixJ family two-component response regulator